MTALPPITEEHELLSFDEAGKKAERALAGGLAEVVFPLRLEHRRVSVYRAVKASAFVFQTPNQRAALLKQMQKFEGLTGAGLELLTLRRSYGGRRQGSLIDLAEMLYAFIQQGGDNLTKLLNLTKRNGLLDELAGQRLAELEGRKRLAEEGESTPGRWT
jgi:hypothetical protein